MIMGRLVVHLVRKFIYLIILKGTDPQSSIKIVRLQFNSGDNSQDWNMESEEANQGHEAQGREGQVFAIGFIYQNG